MSSKKTLGKVALLALFLVSSIQSFAADEAYTIRTELSSITPGNTILVQDNKYNFMETTLNWNNTFVNKNVYNRISLAIDPYSTVPLTTFNYSVGIRLSYYTWDYESNRFIRKDHTTETITLSINYDQGAVHTDKAFYQFRGGNKLEVSIVSVTGTAPSAVYLESEVAVERYYNFDANAKVIGLQHKSVNAAGEVPVHWDYLSGAERYELEWTHLDNYDYNNNILQKVDPSGIPFTEVENGFRFGSTRITTANTFYNIPQVYERGWILYRVRAIGKINSDNYNRDIPGAWSCTPTYLTVAEFCDSKFEVLEHQGNLNWQSSISYAEDGKNKVSASYFDGSLRNRQTTTKMNSDNTTIVGETVYDWQGRPTVNILPVPVQDQKVQYHYNINSNLNGNPYSKTDFDQDQLPRDGSGNTINAGKLATTNGAGNYYSISNPDKTDQHGKYIPDAKGYPFTQTIYSNDNTGRIIKQSGVGEDHTINSGHETKYLYATPEEKELERLFGAEVGNPARYKKNIVIDANGQISVSYLDPQGRVVATMLGGAVPDNVERVSGINMVERDVNIMGIDPATNKSLYEKEDQTSTTYSKGIAVISKGPRTFQYTIESDKFIDVCSNDPEQPARCYDCVYNLEITLQNDHGEQFLVGLDGVDVNSTTATVGKAILEQIRLGNFSGCTSATPSPSNPESSSSFSRQYTTVGTYLPVGKYTISKIVSLNAEATEANFQKYLQDNECLQSYEVFLTNEIEKIAQGYTCEGTCAECLQKLGDFSQYDASRIQNCTKCMTKEEYEVRLDDCKKLCDNEAVDCQSLLSAMKSDMSIYGQYGELRKKNLPDPNINVTATSDNDTPIVPLYYIYDEGHESDFPMSIYNENNTLPQKAWYAREGVDNNWRYPYRKNEFGGVDKHYYNEDGTIAKIPLKKINGIYIPAVKVGAPVEQVGDTYFVEPQYLENLVDFTTRYWKNSFANSLVVYHPEYCYYEYCTKVKSSHDFDYKWNSISTKTDVITWLGAGYINPLGNNPSESIDPYFNPTLNPMFNLSDYNAFKSELMNFKSNGTTTYSIWDMVYMRHHCPFYGTNTCTDDCVFPVGPTLNIDSDEMWVTFRGIYYATKRKYIERGATRYAINNGCYNGCIGVNEKGFDADKDNFRRTKYWAVLHGSSVFSTFAGYKFNAIIGGHEQFCESYGNGSLGHNLLFSLRAALVCRPTPVYTNTTYNYRYRALQSQAYNLEQTCQIQNEHHEFYAFKKKRYIRNSDGINDDQLDENKCLVFEPDGSYTRQECPPDTYENMLQRGKDKVAFGYYEECGQCYTAKLLENFLAAVAKHPSSMLAPPSAQEVNLNCYDPQDPEPLTQGMPAFVPDLEKELNFNSSTAAPIKWAVYSSTADELIVTITKMATPIEVCTLYIRKQAQYNIRRYQDDDAETFSFTWTDIKDICCINRISTSLLGFTSYNPNNLFSVNATVPVTFPGSSDVHYKKIYLEAHTGCINLTCPAPVLCNPGVLLSSVQNLWNTMLYRADQEPLTDAAGAVIPGQFAPAVTSKFLSESYLIDNNITAPNSMPDYTENALNVTMQSYLFDYANLAQDGGVSVRWEAAVSGSQLTINLSRFNPVSGQTASSYAFQFTIPTGELFAFEDIISFSSLMPDKVDPALSNSLQVPAHNFSVLALVQQGAVKKHVWMKGYSTIPIGDCVVAQKKTFE